MESIFPTDPIIGPIWSSYKISTLPAISDTLKIIMSVLMAGTELPSTEEDNPVNIVSESRSESVVTYQLVSQEDKFTKIQVQDHHHHCY